MIQIQIYWSLKVLWIFPDRQTAFSQCCACSGDCAISQCEMHNFNQSEGGTLLTLQRCQCAGMVGGLCAVLAAEGRKTGLLQSETRGKVL